MTEKPDLHHTGRSSEAAGLFDLAKNGPHWNYNFSEGPGCRCCPQTGPVRTVCKESTYKEVDGAKGIKRTVLYCGWQRQDCDHPRCHSGYRNPARVHVEKVALGKDNPAGREPGEEEVGTQISLPTSGPPTSQVQQKPEDREPARRCIQASAARADWQKLRRKSQE